MTKLTITAGPHEFGARMEEVLPLVPLAAEHSLGVAVVSYDGKVFFGLVGGSDCGPDLDILADGIKRGLSELTDLAATSERLTTPG